MEGYPPTRKADIALGFEAFVRRHSGPLLRTLTMVALDREVAADASQEAFLQLYVHWEKVSAYEDPVAWLYRVGINRCRDYRKGLARASGLFHRLTLAAKGSEALAEWDPQPEVFGALKKLPLRQRAAALLYYQADFSVAQVAAAMHISEGAVNSHLHKARESLRKVLEAE